MQVAGVDGCREGWLCVEEREGRLSGHIFRSFAGLLAALPGASVIDCGGYPHRAAGTG